jgi:hypothetical protein
MPTPEIGFRLVPGSAVPNRVGGMSFGMSFGMTWAASASS